jgi:plastocyanin
MTISRARRGVALALAGAVAAVLFGACSAASSTAARAPVAKVRMLDYGYDPTNLTVPKDAMIWVVNVGKVPHSWIIPKVGVGTQDLAPGQSQDLDLSGIAPGTYHVTCDLPGHAQLGSVGTVTITR